MKRHDTMEDVLILEAHEASELLEKGSYYYEEAGKVEHFELFISGAKVLHGTELLILGFCSKCNSYPCVTKDVYEQLTNETV